MRFAFVRVRAVFGFDAGGNRAKQFLERTFANGDRAMVTTRYLGSYEQEIHATDTLAGGAMWSAGPCIGIGWAGRCSRISRWGRRKRPAAVNLTDHIGSMDMVLRFEWKRAPCRPSDGVRRGLAVRVMVLGGGEESGW